MSLFRKPLIPTAPVTPDDPDAVVTLTGKVTHLYCEPRPDGWVAFRFKAGLAEIQAAGIVPEIRPGAIVTLSGKWGQFNGRPQLKVLISQVEITRSKEGITEWLQTIKGIGPRLSDRIYEHYAKTAGDDPEEIWNLLRAEPDKVLEVQGLKKLGDDIVDRVRDHTVAGDLMTWLMSVGVSVAYCRRIIHQFGNAAADVIKENPFELIRVRGIGFKKADLVARKVGLRPDHPFRIRAGLLYVLEEAAAKSGHCFLPLGELVIGAAETLATPEAIIEEEAIRAGIDALSDFKDVVLVNDEVWLRKLHEAELDVSAMLKRLISWPIKRLAFKQELLKAFEQESGLTLHEAQVEAVKSALTSSVSIITGGPGTGKTTITKAVVSMLEQRGQRIALCAPTGRASRRLSEATGRDATTIHRLIGLRDEENPASQDEYLPAEAVIVDETSMVDIRLMRSLVKRLRPGCQLILVGDVDQLPSVGPGKVLADLIDAGCIPTVRLTRIQRQAEGSMIVAGAHAINSGRIPSVAKMSELKSGALAFMKLEDAAELPGRLVDLLRYLEGRGYARDQITVLAPQRTTQIGVNALNDHLQKTFNEGGKPIKEGAALRHGDRVMHIRNNYQLEAFNGDIGWLQEPNEKQREANPPVRAVVDFEGRLVPYTDEYLDELVLAYCSTIHKAQGSEYPVCVVICHSSHWHMLSRRLLYTAVTRGKELVIVVGNYKAMWRAVENARIDNRYTRLKERLSST